MKRLFWTLLALVIGTALYLLFTGPQMLVQPHVRAYQARMPLMPTGAVPREARAPLPSPAAAVTLTNPLPATAANLDRGRTYYGYYCLACHGAGGAGDGPVGQSYTPVPADLRSYRVQTQADGQLLRAMLTGPGHAPVLERVVPPDYRWYLVLYVRSLATNAAPRETNRPGR